MDLKAGQDNKMDISLREECNITKQDGFQNWKPLKKLEQKNKDISIKGIILADFYFRSSPVPFQGVRSASSPGVPPQSNMTSNRRLQQTQAQVNEVVDIMRVNVDKVLERDQKLSELDNRADALQAGASQFETNAAKLKRKYWWKNCKMMIILGAICAIILIIIISE
ncbi:vesicle-associated membrane protein 3-like [Vipera latastei]